jgi:hypothetical protein
MLKFRLPYPPPNAQTEYLDGDLYLPVWGGRTTTESRLINTDPVRITVCGRFCCALRSRPYMGAVHVYARNKHMHT